MARSSVLSSTRSKGSKRRSGYRNSGFELLYFLTILAAGIRRGCRGAWPKDTGRGSALARPAGVAALAAQLVFQVSQALFELIDFLLFVVDGLAEVVDILAIVLLAERLIGVAVVLLLLQAELALEDIELFFCGAELSARVGKALAPVGLVFDFLGFLRFGGLIACGDRRSARGIGRSLCRGRFGVAHDRDGAADGSQLVVGDHAGRLGLALLLLAGLSRRFSHRRLLGGAVAQRQHDQDHARGSEDCFAHAHRLSGGPAGETLPASLDASNGGFNCLGDLPAHG